MLELVPVCVTQTGGAVPRGAPVLELLSPALFCLSQPPPPELPPHHFTRFLQDLCFPPVAQGAGAVPRVCTHHFAAEGPEPPEQAERHQQQEHEDGNERSCATGLQRQQGQRQCCPTHSPHKPATVLLSPGPSF